MQLTLRSEISNYLRQGHKGFERTKLLARNTVYWQGISNDITELISNYETVSGKSPLGKKPLMGQG